MGKEQSEDLVSQKNGSLEGDEEKGKLEKGN